MRLNLPINIVRTDFNFLKLPVYVSLFEMKIKFIFYTLTIMNAKNEKQNQKEKENVFNG